jgi:Uma2 family endonuclease
MTATGIHQDVIGFLYVMLLWYTTERELGKVRFAPFAMYLPELGWSREPDLLFIARANEHRIESPRVVGPADLVVEVVSDDSARRDRVDKLTAYEVAGVPEYWILDPRPGHQAARFLHLDADGRYRDAPLDREGRYHSPALPGFWLDPSWLWHDPLPKPHRVMPLVLGDA